jgi:ligand-binding SRPBCC domain-containing protein
MADSGFASLTHDSVSIVDVETVRDVTFYVIVVTLPGGQTWKVKHRYSDFKDLHDKSLLVNIELVSPSKLGWESDHSYACHCRSLLINIELILPSKLE